MVSALKEDSSGTYRFQSDRVRRKSPMVILATPDAKARRAMHDHLTESGLTVVDASSLDEVVPLAERFFADIAVIDVDGFGAGALGVARQLRAGQRTAAIALTRTARPSVVTFTVSAGFAAVLEAPCEPETLFTEIVVALAAAEEAESLRSGNR